MNAIYTVTPTSGGCVGASFTMTVPITPEPVGVAATLTGVCSQIAFSIDPQLYISNGVISAFNWTQQALPGGLTVVSGAGSGTGLITGSLKNTSNGVLNALYTVTPSNGVCAGVNYVITIPVKSEPVGVTITGAPSPVICSGATVNYDLQNNVSTVPGNSQLSTFQWKATVNNAFVGGESLVYQSSAFITDVFLLVNFISAVLCLR